MAYSVDWVNRNVFVPIGDMILIDGSDYELSADSFWREIRRLEWERTEGLWALQIIAHNNTRTLAGTTYVPENEVVNDYTITMDPRAEKVFLRGDNNNIVDVLVHNGVSVIPSNSAGNTISIVETECEECPVCSAILPTPIEFNLPDEDVLFDFDDSELKIEISDPSLKLAIEDAIAYDYEPNLYELEISCPC